MNSITELKHSLENTLANVDRLPFSFECDELQLRVLNQLNDRCDTLTAQIERLEARDRRQELIERTESCKEEMLQAPMVEAFETVGL